MLNEEELKKRVRAIDLALSSGRKRQSPRTKLVHFCPHDETATDVISLYENFCFALLLMRQKTAEAVLEAKELLERLLHFQVEGNFPVFLHDYPRTWDSLYSLKIAPVFIYLLREFPFILGGSLKDKIAQTLQLMLDRIDKLRSEKPLPPLWEMRYQACLGVEILFQPSQGEEWFEWLVSMQILNRESLNIPYDPSLQMMLASGIVQERGEPRPFPIEWILAENDGYSPRLSRDHPHQLYCGLLWPISQLFNSSRYVESWREFDSNQGFQIFWNGKSLHSFVIPKGKEILLPDTNDPAKGDLVEVEAFCDLAANISIGGKKGTVFQLGDWIEIEADGVKIFIQFTLQEGIGEFCGHISKGNRPTQIACKGPLLYEAFDWRISLRTLRKETPCIIQTEVVCAHSALRASERLSTASPIACNPLST